MSRFCRRWVSDKGLLRAQPKLRDLHVDCRMTNYNVAAIRRWNFGASRRVSVLNVLGFAQRAFAGFRLSCFRAQRSAAGTGSQHTRPIAL